MFANSLLELICPDFVRILRDVFHCVDITGRAYNRDEAFNMQFDGQVGGPGQQTFGGPASAFIVDQEDESANRNEFRPPFYDNSGQSSRSMSTSTAQRERAGQSGAHPSKQVQHSQQQTSASPLPSGHANRAAGSANSQAYKQLSYFKSVTDHHKHQQPAPSPASKASATGPVRFSSVRAAPVASTADADSPDNVRDNFISPGHYPGSMAHLTQAASEVKAKSALDSLASSSASSSSKLEASLVTKSSQANERAMAEQQSSQQAAVSGDKQLQEQSVTAASEQNRLISMIGTAGESRKADDLSDEATITATATPTSLVSVTPVPESQQEESQQIMAPILMSTTTMAPMLSTTSPASTAAPSGTTTPTSVTNTSITSTSQAPSLKRFKFRKYR